MSFMEIKNVSFAYPNGFQAINDISLNIEKGERIAIIGENGAGKSTTAKLMNGLLKPSKGDIFVDGINTKNQTSAQTARRVGYMFQNPDDQIYNNTVYKEIICTLKYFKFPQDEIDRRAIEVMEVARLLDKKDENPYDLSFSHRRFVAIAAVMANYPDVVILDEPTAGQDKDGLDCLEDILSYLELRNTTIITITHDIEFVVKNFHRTVVMANSHIIADADKKDIFWNMPVLTEAALQQPYISILAREMDIKSQIIDIDGFVDALKI